MLFRKFMWVLAVVLAGHLLPAAGTVSPVRWEKDLATVKRLAAVGKLPVVMLFTGSDWCPWCVKLEQNVLSKPSFRDAVRGKAVLLYLDFPRQKAQDPKEQQQNRELARKYRIEGFPTTVVLGPDGKVRGEIVGAPGNFLEQLLPLLGR